MRLFGWCNTGHHQLCRVEFVSQFQVTHRCECPCHETAEEES